MTALDDAWHGFTTNWLYFLLAAAVLAAAMVLASAASNRILARMAARNAFRRPRQTATVVAGLMVGTAIVSAALVAGGSAGYAIRGYVYQSLGHIDESVTIRGYPYFSEEVYEGFLDETSVQQGFDGVTAFAIWEATAENPRTGLFEPSVYLVGFDTSTTQGMGTFDGPGGSTTGAGLASGRAIVSDHLQKELGLQVGDRVRLTHTTPVDPSVPVLFPIEGELTGIHLPGLPALPAQQEHVVDVAAGATRLTVAIVWQPPEAAGTPIPGSAAPTVTATLVDPDGRVRATGSTSTPPIWLNATTTPEEVLPEGEWTLTLSTDAAAFLPYRGIAAALHPVYDLERLRARADALEQEWGDGWEGLQDALGARVFTRPKEQNVSVASVASEGRIDMFDFRMVVYVPIQDVQAMLEREGQVNYIAFSNPGGIESGVEGTERALTILNATLLDIQGRYPGVPAIEALELEDEKRQFLRVADDAGQMMTSLLVFAGSLSIITGLLLILNIFTMLAEERRSELGMARAVGLQRRDLVRVFLYEGSLYAVAAAALGALLGLALAYGMILVMNAVIAQLGEGLSIPPVEYRPTFEAVAAAFSVGVLLTFATIWAASNRQSRLNVVRAIRRIEEPEKTGSWTAALAVGPVLVLLGAAATVIGWMPSLHFTGRFSMQVFGPLLLLVGLGFLLRPLLRRRWLYPALAALALAYYAASIFIIDDFDDISEANLVGPIRGVLIALATVVLIVYFERGTRLVGRALARIPRLRAVAVPAVSYPLHKKFRTGMTLAMFTLVILSIGFFSIFGALFDTDPSRQTGGYDIEARTTLVVEDIDAHATTATDDLPIEVRHDLRDWATEDPDFITVEGGGTGRYGDFQHHVYGYGEEFARENGFRLLWRHSDYATDAQAYQAVLDRDDAIIVSYVYSTDERNQDLSYEVGDTLEMHLGSDVIEYEIIGIQEQFHHSAVWLPSRTVEGLFPVTEGLHLYRLETGADAAEVARELEQRYRAVGMDADDAKAEVLREQESFRNILSAMKLFLGLGLIVGVLSLGIITSRSVLERRQEIGMLRALGYTGKQVRWMFFIEVTYTLMSGALAGIACAVLVTYGLWYAVIKDLHYPYVVPWGEIGLLVLVSYLVALLATAAPIRRSAKVAPAEALRYVE